MKSSPKNILVNFGLMFLVIVLFLFLFEIISPYLLTVCVDFKNCPGAHYEVENIEFNMSVSLNSDGFRDQEFENVPQDAIAVIGDSIVFGWGVEENQTFVHLLEKHASRIDNYVLNFGVEGTGIGSYLERLKKYGVKANIIILSYYPTNDIILENYTQEGTLPQIEASKLTHFMVDVCHSLKSCILFHKALYRISHSNLGQAGRVNPLTERNITSLPNVDQKYVNWALEWKINPYQVINHLFIPNLYEYYEQLIKDFDDFPPNKQLLGEFITTARSDGKRVLVVLIPTSLLVSEDYAPQFIELGHSPEKLNLLVCNMQLHQKIKRFLVENYGAEVIDIQEEMCRSTQADKYFYKIDGHLTPAGNEFVAEIIHQQLTPQKTNSASRENNTFFSRNPFMIS